MVVVKDRELGVKLPFYFYFVDLALSRITPKLWPSLLFELCFAANEKSTKTHPKVVLGLLLFSFLFYKDLSRANAEPAPAPLAGDTTPSSRTRCRRTSWRWAAALRGLAGGCDRTASATCSPVPPAVARAGASAAAPRQTQRHYHTSQDRATT